MTSPMIPNHILSDFISTILIMQRQLFERINLIFKQKAFFLHTSAPFSSVLLPLPHKLPLLKPLLKQLQKKEDFDLQLELSKFKISQKETEVVSVHSDVVTPDSMYGIKFDEETQFVVQDSQSGQLSISKTMDEKRQLLAVILFQSVKNKPVKYINSANFQLNQILLKITVFVILYKLFITVENNTRVQNFHKVQEKKKS